MNSTAASSSQQYQLITDKRQALESLIHIATSVHNQHCALSELSLAAKPSQEFPKKTAQFFSAIETSLKDKSSSELIGKLESVENTIENGFKEVIRLISVDPNQLRAGEIEQLDSDAFNQFINDFKRLTRTSLAMRFLLKKRGMAIAPFHLPYGQDTLNHQIKQLKQKEQKCVSQVKQEINIIIEDSRSLLAQPDLNENIKNNLERVVQGMRVNLEHLEQGGCISEIPNTYEVVVMSSQPLHEAFDADTESKPTNTSNKQLFTKTEQLSGNEAVPSFWWRLKTWLSSPMQTTWKSLKQPRK